jgi:hypothetical protein
VERNSLAKALDDELKLMGAPYFDIGDSAGRRLKIAVQIAAGNNVAESHDLHRAAAPLGIQRHPEFATASGGAAHIDENESYLLSAGNVKELYRRSRRSNVVARHPYLRE